MRVTAVLPLLAAASLCAEVAHAAPAHALCNDLGPTLGVGVSSFSAAGDWPAVAAQEHGVDWRFLYLYVLPTDDPEPDVQSYLLSKIELASSLGAMPVFTFYQLLQIGQRAGVAGSEPDVVQKVLGDRDRMREYFDNFVLVLRTSAMAGVPVLVHVEPDSWGFMMWAMGVEGNADATSVPVAVASSGHPDVAGFPDHAGGLGQALVKLRDQHAPSVRLGWHASNFRVGARPEVVTGFYSSMGEWDVLVGENFHLNVDDAVWWEPWDESLLQANLSWLEAVTSSAGVPFLSWQERIGTTDWHLFSGDRKMLERFAAAGLGGVMFELLGSGDPDDFRASGPYGAVPPPGSTAGGTAADMRARLAAYSENPLAWPAGSPCAQAGGAGSSGAGSGGATGGGAAGGGATAGSAGGGATGEEGGCQVQPRAGGAGVALAAALGVLAAGLRRRRRAPPVSGRLRGRRALDGRTAGLERVRPSLDEPHGSLDMSRTGARRTHARERRHAGSNGTLRRRPAAHGPRRHGARRPSRPAGRDRGARRRSADRGERHHPRVPRQPAARGRHAREGAPGGSRLTRSNRGRGGV
ncbi:hypothetical protein WME76_12785 [Sorangium sp. So ce119]|uniref:hypothetical protein n=1 Tax=Sorangium sp. So ce119 TaxID=3133279 RepID=UPI003F5D5BBF